ncbi:hypothetical protein SODALDRAFT_375945 [Sodiomyces alkalinus F11]|uniref:Uncharacterized protein n=1 Tax=Sodiomyces alkalinus (strain CBS 110278 / VKM F-3762 / F11) TaxID=1314773 RepID=A0A3N2QAN9_SODAK|nr:hypothetical protein SODALDRAFT_375945 [Sodiomyces alkalinus F11]ROT43821.1 hypothetical protein SODALDRAFT_375945 [Sodiomyces alkalinus F11]
MSKRPRNVDMWTQWTQWTQRELFPFFRLLLQGPIYARHFHHFVIIFANSRFKTKHGISSRPQTEVEIPATRRTRSDFRTSSLQPPAQLMHLHCATECSPLPPVAFVLTAILQLNSGRCRSSPPQDRGAMMGENGQEAIFGQGTPEAIPATH